MKFLENLERKIGAALRRLFYMKLEIKVDPAPAKKLKKS
jgi:hypothetical protein